MSEDIPNPECLIGYLLKAGKAWLKAYPTGIGEGNDSACITYWYHTPCITIQDTTPNVMVYDFIAGVYGTPDPPGFEPVTGIKCSTREQEGDKSYEKKAGKSGE